VNRASGSPTNERDPTTAAQWLESPRLTRAAARVAYQYSLGPEDLDDMLQELRIALWKGAPEIRVGASWILQVACHKAVDLVRKQARTRLGDRTLVNSPENQTHDHELVCLLRARVARLPSQLREFYELHYRQGLSERETARSLGLCRSSVRWLDRCCRRHIAGEVPEPHLPLVSTRVPLARPVPEH